MVVCKWIHCVKSVQIRNYFWSVFSYIRTEYRKIRTRNNSVFGHFSSSDNNVENSSKSKGSEKIFKWKKDRDSLFLGRGVSSCGSKYLLDRISASGSSIALFSFSMISWFWKLCFLVRALNFLFLPTLVSYNSSFEMLENGTISSKHFMQYQAYTHCWRYQYIDELILLHLTWIQEWQ